MAATTVVASAYDTSGNGGRKIVRLSNGWLVSVAKTTDNFYFYKSVDNGLNWSQLCYVNNANIDTNDIAITSNNTKVFMVWGYSTTAIKRLDFEATTVTNTNIEGNSTMIDQTQTAIGNVSLCIDGNGHLHAAWASKNATYPNSFNIRYSKSTDGGATWAAVTQITTHNSTTINNTNPCIVVKSNNYPVILHQYNDSSSNVIWCFRWNGSSWASSFAGDGSSYTQSNPCVAVDSNDNIHVVWDGLDSTDTTTFNIRYAKSTDGGATWKKSDGTAGHDKLTTGNSYNQATPTITIDKTNKVYVLWRGIDSTIATGTFQIRKKELNGTIWSSIITLTNNATGSLFDPQTLWSKFNMNSDDAVRWIYEDSKAPASVKYDSIALLWSKKLMGVSTPTKIMGMQPSKVMGVQ